MTFLYQILKSGSKERLCIGQSTEKSCTFGTMKVLCVYGTRPEAIKMAPVINALKESSHFEVKVLTTGQHVELVKTINDLFEIYVDYPENIFIPGQGINEILAKSIVCVSKVVTEFDPDLVIVQGDTTTAMAGAITAFSSGKKVIHIEAGLRTKDVTMPFPEEFNRRVISLCATLHFAATQTNKTSLLSEGIPQERVLVTGNTVIDAAKFVVNTTKAHEPREDLINFFKEERDYFLLTLHRRESWGPPMKRILEEIEHISREFPFTNILFPVHPNPLVTDLAREILGKRKNIFLLPSLDYVDMIHAISKCRFVVTDSGGIQEEAPFFKKPVLVVRNETERMEGVINGCSQLIGTESVRVYESIHKLLSDSEEFDSMSNSANPYGDGKSAERIVGLMEWFFGFSKKRPKEFN